MLSAMNVTTNRLPLSLVLLRQRSSYLTATLTLVSLAAGCRSAQRFGSLVQVTEDPAAQVADVPALEQRLATTKTTAGATPVTSAKPSNNTAGVAGMPEIFRDKNVAPAAKQTVGTIARLSDSDLPLTETRNTNVAAGKSHNTKKTISAATANKNSIARAEAIAARRSATKMQLTDTRSSLPKPSAKLASTQKPAQQVASSRPASQPVSGSLSDLPEVSVRLPESMVVERAKVQKLAENKTKSSQTSSQTKSLVKKPTVNAQSLAAKTKPTKTQTAKARSLTEELSPKRTAKAELAALAKSMPPAPSVTQSNKHANVSKPVATESIAQSKEIVSPSRSSERKAPAPSPSKSRPADTNLVAASATDLTLPKPSAAPKVSRTQIAQTHQPLALEAVLRSRLDQLPKLGTKTAPSTGPAPQRIGSIAPAATSQIARQTVAPVQSKVAKSPIAASGRVGDIGPSGEVTQGSPIAMQLPAEEAPSRILNANQIRPASHAQRGNEMQVTKTASAKLPSSSDRAPKLPGQTGSLTNGQSSVSGNKPDQLTEAQLYQQLLSRLSNPGANETPLEKERRLIVARHLMVLAGDPNAATQTMDGLNPTEQRYMKNQLLGLWTMIDPKGHPSSGRRITEALPKFREATRYMAAATDSLTLKHLEFCTEIESYGQIKPFEGNRFIAGQQVILYCEVENFAAAPQQNAFQTKLQGTYDIYNEKGVKVVSQLLPVDQQQSRNQLRDYFVAYQMSLPKQLAKGTYRLQLTIEDAIGKKYGQANIPFEIQ